MIDGYATDTTAITGEERMGGIGYVAVPPTKEADAFLWGVTWP